MAILGTADVVNDMNILATADVSVLPTEIAKLEGFFDGMEKVTATTQGGKA